MPHTIADLISIKNLSEADVKATLLAAGLSLESSEYSDQDIQGKFDAVRLLFDSGQVSDYETAREVFTTQNLVNSTKPRPVKAGAETNRNRKGQKSVPTNSTSPASPPRPENNKTDTDKEFLSVGDLVNLVKQHLSLTLSLKQVVAVLEASQLPDKEYYTQSEGNRFLIACRCITQEGTGDIGTRIQDAAASMETGLISLLNQVMQARAQEVPGLMKQLYLQNVALSLVENQEDIESFFMQIKDSIISGIEGKSPLRSILAVEWTQPPLPESGNLPSQSLPTSDNGTSSELAPDTKL